MCNFALIKQLRWHLYGLMRLTISFIWVCLALLLVLRVILQNRGVGFNDTTKPQLLSSNHKLQNVPSSYVNSPIAGSDMKSFFLSTPILYSTTKWFCRK